VTTVPRALLAIALSATTCGEPAAGTSTTTGITTVQPGSSESADSEGTTTSSSSSAGEGASSSTTLAVDTSTTSALPDLPGFETLGPVQGCGKIDILFVINDGGSLLEEEASTEDVLKIRKGGNGFIAAMQEQAADYDLHVMVVKGDPEWRGTNGPKDCCVKDKPCDELGTFPCDNMWEGITQCDSTLGAGVRYPAGYMASNRDCELADGHRYITEAQDDFATAFDCILNVGQTGGKQLYLGAMVQAVGPTLNAPDGCNSGFVRPDAMLVVVILSAYQDFVSAGTPEGLGASLIAAKKGYADGIVVVGLLDTVGDFDGDQCGEVPEDRTRQFIEGFPTHVLGSYCDPDISARLSEAIGVIQTACEKFTPPG